jgi:hypothetical protein
MEILSPVALKLAEPLLPPELKGPGPPSVTVPMGVPE